MDKDLRTGLHLEQSALTDLPLDPLGTFACLPCTAQFQPVSLTLGFHRTGRLFMATVLQAQGLYL